MLRYIEDLSSSFLHKIFNISFCLFACPKLSLFIGKFFHTFFKINIYYIYITRHFIFLFLFLINTLVNRRLIVIRRPTTSTYMATYWLSLKSCPNYTVYVNYKIGRTWWTPGTDSIPKENLVLCLCVYLEKMSTRTNRNMNSFEEKKLTMELWKKDGPTDRQTVTQTNRQTQRQKITTW